MCQVHDTCNSGNSDIIDNVTLENTEMSHIALHPILLFI